MISAAAEFPPRPGQWLMLRDDLALVLAPNPSAMTGPGTRPSVTSSAVSIMERTNPFTPKP